MADDSPRVGKADAVSFLDWLAQQPAAWREAFNAGRATTRERFAAEEESLDEVGRHIKAARMIGGGEA